MTMIFKKDKKKELLQGRTLKYLTDNKIIECTSVHLGNILNGKQRCSSLLAQNITKSVSPDAKVEDYFDEE